MGHVPMPSPWRTFGPNVEFCDAMSPQGGDLVVVGKKGLDAFPGTNLEQMLMDNGITTIALGGFLTNCCVESTMRTACELEFNVVTLTDCCAATSVAGHKAAVDGTFSMFSNPTEANEFLESLENSPIRGHRMTSKSVASFPRTFTAHSAKGGCHAYAPTTALVMIEFQREFTDVGGKLHDAVREVMAQDHMLANAQNACKRARLMGCKIIHVPISLAKDKSDNPNRGLGILKGCADGGLFEAGTWSVEFSDEMSPQAGDLVVQGKKGLDAFFATDLEKLLVDSGIETIAVGGFLTNCCVESTVRTACEKGFNVVTLTDCCAATSVEGHKAAIEGTLPMFSMPSTWEVFLESVEYDPSHQSLR